MYAKLVDGELIAAPKEFIEDGKKIVGFTPDFMLARGYKPVVIPVCPNDGNDYKEEYTETEDSILLSWVKVESGGAVGDFASGTFVPAEDIMLICNANADRHYTIEHGLGAVPNIVTIWAEISQEEGYIPMNNSFVFASYTPLTYQNAIMMSTYNTTGSTAAITSVADADYKIIRCTDTEVILSRPASSGSYLRAGRMYHWAAAAIDIA